MLGHGVATAFSIILKIHFKTDFRNRWFQKNEVLLPSHPSCNAFMSSSDHGAC